MKKILTLLLILMLVLTVGCGAPDDRADSKDKVSTTKEPTAQADEPISSDLDNIDDLDAELDLGELEDLDSELDFEI